MSDDAIVQRQDEHLAFQLADAVRKLAQLLGARQ